MLKRLIEQEHPPSGDRQLSELLSSVAPFEVDPFSKRRIWVRLERSTAHAPRPRRFWLRPLVIATVLISGTAMAELGHRYVVQGSGFWGAAPREPGASKPARAAIAPAAPIPLAPAVPSTVIPAVPSTVIPAVPSASPARAQPKASRSRPEAGEDATPVVAAIQALRTERDPARAQALLNDYLQTNPRGTLSGDALALSIEAASARHDPRAAEYARRYLAAYPQGKYRELAKRALQAQR